MDSGVEFLRSVWKHWPLNHSNLPLFYGRSETIEEVNWRQQVTSHLHTSCHRVSRRRRQCSGWHSRNSWGLRRAFACVQWRFISGCISQLYGVSFEAKREREQHFGALLELKREHGSLQITFFTCGGNKLICNTQTFSVGSQKAQTRIKATWKIWKQTA